MNQRGTLADAIHQDPQAPVYHFIVPQGCCRPFDPNGAIFWNGRYCLFYIFQDSHLPHRGHSWGHVSSADLLHWTYHRTALAPAAADPELEIGSGGALVNKVGVPTIIYHGVKAGTCIATAEDDELIRWRKSEHNPVIPIPDEGDRGYGVYNIFDPHAWLEGDTYYVILGGRVKPCDVPDTAYLYHSTDLIHWEYLRPFYTPNPQWTLEQEDCACPNFFKLGRQHVLTCIRHARGARCYVGDYRFGTFVPKYHQWMNWPGGSSFAPESLLDDSGRRIFWMWVLDQRKSGKGRASRHDVHEHFADAVSAMSMPRVLSLDDDGRLLFDPTDQLKTLRRNARHHENVAVESSREVSLDGVAGDVLELQMKAESLRSGSFGRTVRAAPDGSEHTVITVNLCDSTLSIDTTRSTSSIDICQPFPLRGEKEQTDVYVQTAPFELATGELLELRLFLDKSMLEVYANRRQCLMQRIYPSRQDSLGTSLFSQNGSTKVHSLAA